MEYHSLIIQLHKQLIMQMVFYSNKVDKFTRKLINFVTNLLYCKIINTHVSGY